jgi:adiponectin receptor
MWGVELTLLFNTLGAIVYVLRFPERRWPRRFDIFGASHQLMHCAIIIAGLAWLAGMITAFDNTHRTGP